MNPDTQPPVKSEDELEHSLMLLFARSAEFGRVFLTSATKEEFAESVKEGALDHQEAAHEAMKLVRVFIKQEAERHADKLIGKNTYAVRPSGGSNAWKAQDELRNEMRSKNIYPLKEERVDTLVDRTQTPVKSDTPKTVEEILETLLSKLGGRDRRGNWWGNETKHVRLESDINRAIEAINALRLADMEAVIGKDWPYHCDLEYMKCDQCRNRMVLNGRAYEQRQIMEKRLNG